MAAALLAAAPSARAQTRLEIQPFAGETFFVGAGPGRFELERPGADPLVVEEARLEDSWTAGVTGGLRLGDRFAVEAVFVWVPTWLTGRDWTELTDVYAFMYGVTGTFHVPVPGPVHPFWGVGLGAQTYDFSGTIHSHTRATTSVVAGVSWEMGGGRALRVQGRDFLARFESGVAGVEGGWEHALMVTAGLHWSIRLGSRGTARTGGRRGGGVFLP